MSKVEAKKNIKGLNVSFEKIFTKKDRNLFIEVENSNTVKNRENTN